MGPGRPGSRVYLVFAWRGVPGMGCTQVHPGIPAYPSPGYTWALLGTFLLPWGLAALQTPHFILRGSAGGSPTVLKDVFDLLLGFLSPQGVPGKGLDGNF